MHAGLSAPLGLGGVACKDQALVASGYCLSIAHASKCVADVAHGMHTALQVLQMARHMTAT